MKKTRFLWLLGVLLLMALPTGAALAAPEPIGISGFPFDRILPGEDFILKDGETERGDVVVLGGSAEIEDGAVLEGDLAVFAGDVEIGGAVQGNVAVIGGDVDVLDTAHIEGDCVVMGGEFDIGDGARIDGEVVTSPDGSWFPFMGQRDWDWDWDGPRIPPIPTIPSPRTTPPSPPRIVYRHETSFAGRVGGALLSAIAIGVVALLAALFWPRHTDKVRSVVVRQPAVSGLVGFLTLLAVGLLTPFLVLLSLVLILVCIGLLGFPLIALLWLIVGAACLFGWAAIGQLVGRWIGDRLDIQGMTPAAEAGLGAFGLVLVLGLIWAIPFVGISGGLLGFGILCVGLGAVVLTRFGHRDYSTGQPVLPRGPRTPEPPDAPAAPATPIQPEPPTPDDEPFEADLLESEGPFPEK
jgi:hypothetical protein